MYCYCWRNVYIAILFAALTVYVVSGSYIYVYDLLVLIMLSGLLPPVAHHLEWDGFM
jgi:hypothetical protein